MSHAITIGGLLLTLGVIAGLITAAGGLLAIFAGGMSDAPQAGDAISKQGCIVLAVGVALFGASVWGLVA